MSALLYLGLANAACAAVLAVLAVVIARWARRPALAHGVWLLVLVKLVTPPLFPLPVASLPAAPSPEVVVGTDELRPAPVVYTAVHESDSAGPPSPADVWIEMEKGRAKGAVVQQRVPAVQERASAPLAAPASEPSGDFVGNYVDANALPVAPGLGTRPAAPPAPPALADVGEFVATVLGGVWLVGSVVWFVRSARRLARFQRLLRLARPAPEHVRTLAARLAQQFGLRRCPEVLLLPAPLPPMVWGALGRVRVLLPARLAERLDEDQLAALLAHEFAHVRRGDHWVRRLEFVVLGLYWWYPLAWWARTRLQEAEEECCDAWVVEALPARAYAAAIVATVDFLANDLEPAPALASGLGRLDGLKRRLTLILTDTSPKRLSVAGRLAVLVLGLALLPLLPTLGRSENKPDDKAAPNQDDEGAATEPGEEAIAFQPNPLVLVGGNFENFSLTVSADGRYLAAGSGYWDRPGEVHVWTVSDHKEVLAYATAKGVASVAFSNDGRYIGSAGYDSQAIIREFPSGKVVQVLPLDGSARMAFSPDNKTVATVTEAKTVKLWDLTTGKEIARLEGELYRWHCLAFSHDGKLLAVGGGDWNENGVSQVNFWDTETHKLVGKLSGHTRPVLCLAFSPDKKTIATGAADNTVRLWQLDGFKELGALDGHENLVEGLAYTPDGGTLISASHDGTVRLWDVAKKMPITRLDGHVAPVRSVALSHDGKQLFSGGAARMLKVWDLATQKETGNYQPRVDRPGEDSIILATAYSPDGKTLATAHENGAVKIRSAANGDLLRIVEGHEDAVTCLAFTKDGKTLITGSADQTVRLWDMETGKPRGKLEGHTSWVYALALSPDGKTLASAGYDKTVRLWDLETLKKKETLLGHKGAVRALAFSPDGKVLASGAGDQTITLWDLEKTKNSTTLTGHDGTVRSLAFSPNGKTLASGSEDATVRLWDVETGKAKTVLKGHNDKVTAVTFSPRGRYVVSAGMDSSCRLWDTTTDKAVQTLRGHDDAVTCLAWAPGGRFLVSGGYDKAVKLWVVTTGVLRMLTGHTGPVQMASFSPEGKYVLSCSAWPAGDKTIRLWDPQTGKELRKFEGHTGPIGCAVFSPDGKRALSGSHDKTVRLWDVETGKQLHLLKGHEDEVPRVAFSPDGKRAASASHDKTVRIWDLESGDCLHVLRGHADHVRGLVFLPDGTHVVSADVQGTLRVWDADKGTETNKIELPKGRINHLRLAPDGKRLAVAHAQSVRVLELETGKQLRQYDGHTQGVTDVAWSPDGKALLSGSYDNTARLWDVETGRELHVFRGHRNFVWSINFSADGQRILTAGGGARNGEEWVAGNDFAIRIWPLPDTSAKPGRVFKFSNLKSEK